MRREYSTDEILMIKRIAGGAGFILGILLMSIVLFLALPSEPEEGRVVVKSKSVGEYELLYSDEYRKDFIRFRTADLGVWSWTDESAKNVKYAMEKVQSGEGYFEVYLDWNPNTKKRYEQQINFIEPFKMKENK